MLSSSPTAIVANIDSHSRMAPCGSEIHEVLAKNRTTFEPVPRVISLTPLIHAMRAVVSVMGATL